MKLNGIAASPGIAIGRAYLISEEPYCVIKRNIGESQIKKEISRFRKAIQTVDIDFKKQKERVSTEMGKTYAKLFNAYGLILKDPLFYKDTIKVITEERVNVEYALQTVIDRITKTFSMLDDEYMRDRIRDVQDVANRVMRVLLGQEKVSLKEIHNRVALVAHALHPSDAVEIKKENVIGFVMDAGGKTSHIVIMAESLEIPAVVGLKRVTREISPGDLIIIDGNEGVVYINPETEILKEYRQRKRKQAKLRKQLIALRDKPAVTKCGEKVELNVNIEDSSEASVVRQYGASGVGLYRTEFFYLNKSDLPGEEEIYKNLKSVADKIFPAKITVRTIDIGAEKISTQLGAKHEGNPFMGLRGVRLCLAYPELFKTQLRGILRASEKKNIHIMYPMITGVKEIRSANLILEEVKGELDKRGIEYDRDIKVGIMVETPAAVMNIENLAKEVDFFSIGTNDLIQYSLAVDRTSGAVSYLYNPGSISILRMIEKIISGARESGCKVSMCGEMAGETIFTELLLGLGLRSFSMSGIAVHPVKKVIRGTSIGECEELADRVMKSGENEEIMKILKERQEKTQGKLY